MAKRGMPMGGGAMGGGMMKQIQKMQSDMMRAQQELEAREYTAAAGGGAVTATVSGKHQILSLVIAPEAIDPDDAEMLSDMILAACNEALREADETMAEEMSRFTGGLNLPF